MRRSSGRAEQQGGGSGQGGRQALECEAAGSLGPARRSALPAQATRARGARPRPTLCPGCPGPSCGRPCGRVAPGPAGPCRAQWLGRGPRTVALRTASLSGVLASARAAPRPAELVMLLEWWSCTECTLFADRATVGRFGKEHAVVILNHNFEIDFLCGWTMCERFGVLGSSKVLAKRELLYVPLIGWTWYFLEIVFCKRKWEEDRDTVISGLKRLSDYPEYMWFLLYCEGTRFTEKKHRVSMEVAAAKGLPALKYHLLPRTKGFTTAVQCLRGTVSAVYDVTLNFRGKKIPSLLGILYGKKYEADMCVRRRSAARPGGEELRGAWRADAAAALAAACPGTERPARLALTRSDRQEVPPGGHPAGREGSSPVAAEAVPAEGRAGGPGAGGLQAAARRVRASGARLSLVDALQDAYSQTGVFPGERHKPARRPWTLLNFLCWATVLLSPLFSFVLGVFASGSPLLILTFLGFVGAASFAVRRLIGVTEIEKGSSYGNQEFKKE
ncbi:1-acyl-sn-glycerol-3-phosphate acyltransferase gamma [Galemys pyrenaicus]|uniref:1-acyl-sn-glycerol-3-phosphate acyltransferase gamma n=1 Tax=Galemys pyrenaicus TaxID=202257 RepID=A0A8J6A1P5_GALPY|nr:1-acyl-sn-glycerol-3-phosphate acyltransferase gamma [Galemys pyrenaicus]